MSKPVNRTCTSNCTTRYKISTSRRHYVQATGKDIMTIFIHASQAADAIPEVGLGGLCFCCCCCCCFCLSVCLSVCVYVCVCMLCVSLKRLHTLLADAFYPVSRGCIVSEDVAPSICPCLLSLTLPICISVGCRLVRRRFGSGNPVACAAITGSNICCNSLSFFLRFVE